MRSFTLPQYPTATLRTAAFAMSPELPDRLFTPELRQRLGMLVDLASGPALDDFATAAARDALSRAHILITGWSCPPITAAVLELAPHLEAVVHTAGTVKGHVTQACWERGITISTAAAANALPVAEYTLAAILFAAKDVRAIEQVYRSRRAAMDLRSLYPSIGAFGRSVGVVGASRIGRRVIELLRPFDFSVSVHDPHLSDAEAARLEVRRRTLPDLLADSDIVTLHAPSLPETLGMIDRAGLAAMRDGATLINTARGALVDQDALIEELGRGRLNAVLDVTEPDVLPPGSPLFELPNVTLTPHLAGAHGNELHRLGAAAIAEVERLVAGKPFAHPVALSDLARSA
jgi:phosphoglycerate dehydrogenase-like enzyme